MIWINAGHFKYDSGALGLIERDEAMKIRDFIKQKAPVGSVGFVPDNLNLRKSIDWVNKRCEKEDIAIGIHLNSHINKQKNGTECYYYKEKELASKLSKAVSDKIGTKNSGAIPDIYSYVGKLGWVRYIKCRAVVLECLYISNPYDKSRLDYEKIADAIISAVLQKDIQCREEKQLIRQLISFIVSLFKGR